MPLTSADALALSKSFRDLSVAIGDFRFAHWDALGEANRQLLEDEEWSILNASSDRVTKAVGLGLDESDPAAKKVQGGDGERPEGGQDAEGYQQGDRGRHRHGGPRRRRHLQGPRSDREEREGGL